MVVQIEELVTSWEALRATRSRLAKVSELSGLLQRCEPDDLAIVVSYLSGDLPQGRIGLGWASVNAAAVEPSVEPSLTVGELHSTLSEIKATSGAGSKRAKADLLDSALRQATASEQDFIKRLLLGGLRQGSLVGLMIDAVAQAEAVPVPLVRRAAMVTGDLPLVAQRAREGGADALAEFGLEVMTALQPMLAQSAPSVATAIEKLGTATVEWKIDGARVQVHRSGDDVAVFTRNLRDITASMPDVVGAVAELDVDAIVLDGEAVALSPAQRPIAFQDTMSRFSSDDDGNLSVLFFDCLHLNGTDLIDLPMTQRHDAMRRTLPSELIINRITTDSADTAQAFFDEAIAAGHEGVMCKSPDSEYAAGRRGAAWIKVKPVHTLDLVVLAVEWGSGRRQGWLSNIHLGARDPDDAGQFVMLGKTFKGMTDEMLAWQTDRFLELETHRDRHIVQVRPEQVVEIALDGIQRSSRYPGGVALRFARVKGYRTDKTAAEADTLDTVKSIGQPTR